MPTNLLLSDTYSNESSSPEESDGSVEIELRKGTEADGIHQYQLGLPLKNIKLVDFHEILEELNDSKQKLTFASLKKKMKD